ncbi:MAG: hypothetical protein ABIJ47_15805 [Candidatus Bathyarchaeota archaeon]
MAEIQAAYYMVAATGVLIAAIFHVLNMRATRRNMELTLQTRRMGQAENIAQQTRDSQGMRAYFELLNMEWMDYDDFEKKYGSDNNVENAAMRYATWSSYNSIGSMLRKGMVEAEDIYDAGMIGVIFLWAKFKDVIEESRRRYNGQDYLRDFEYLAGEMLKVKLRKDPSYKVPETLSRYIPDE